MKIEQLKITVGQVYESWRNDAEEGVSGFGGFLDVRPKYQREFVFKDRPIGLAHIMQISAGTETVVVHALHVAIVENQGFIRIGLIRGVSGRLMGPKIGKHRMFRPIVDFLYFGPLLEFHNDDMVLFCLISTENHKIDALGRLRNIIFNSYITVGRDLRTLKNILHKMK